MRIQVGPAGVDAMLVYSVERGGTYVRQFKDGLQTTRVARKQWSGPGAGPGAAKEPTRQKKWEVHEKGPLQRRFFFESHENPKKRAAFF